jgi:hypothetical protein
VRNGPGSAAHHFVLRCARDTTNYAHATSPPGREALRDCRLIPISHCQTATSRAPGKTHRPAPASNRNSPFPLRLAHCAPGPNLLPSSATPEGAAERRQARVPCCCAARVARGAHLAIGALASRRSTVAIFGPGEPARPVRQRRISSRKPRRTSRYGLAGGAGPPRPRSQTSAAGRHTRSAIRIVSGDAPHRAGYCTLL